MSLDEQPKEVELKVDYETHKSLMIILDVGYPPKIGLPINPCFEGVVSMFYQIIMGGILGYGSHNNFVHLTPYKLTITEDAKKELGKKTERLEEKIDFLQGLIKFHNDYVEAFWKIPKASD